MFLNKNNNSSYAFEAPNISGDASKKVTMKFPTSEKVTPTITSNAASVNVERQETIIDLGSVVADQTLTLVPSVANLNVGARVIVSWTSDTTARAITVMIGEDTVAILAGTISAKVNAQLIWDGSTFLAL